MNRNPCPWIPISEHDERGKRRMMCDRCHLTIRTIYGADRIHGCPLKMRPRFHLGAFVASWLARLGITKRRVAWLLWKAGVIESLEQGCGCEERERRWNLWGYKLTAWAARLWRWR